MMDPLQNAEIPQGFGNLEHDRCKGDFLRIEFRLQGAVGFRAADWFHAAPPVIDNGFTINPTAPLCQRQCTILPASVGYNRWFALDNRATDAYGFQNLPFIGGK